MSYNPLHFLDREKQLTPFEDRVAGRSTSPVLLYHGPLGAGKSWMLYRVRTLCGKARTTCALLDFQHDSLDTPEAIIRRLADDIGGAFGEAIWRECDALDREPSGEPVTGPAGAAQPAPAGGDVSAMTASVLEAIKRALPEQLARQVVLEPPGGGPLPAAQPAPSRQIVAAFGDIGAGANVVTGDGNVVVKIVINHSNELPAPERESDLKQQRRTSRLTQVWRAALEELVAGEHLVLLFDHCECATDVVIKWLRTKLLGPLLEGTFPSVANLALVMGGDPSQDKWLWLDKLIGWGEGVAAQELGNLPPEAVKKYWIDIRQLDESTLDKDFVTRGALPGLMVIWANYKAGV